MHWVLGGKKARVTRYRMQRASERESNHSWRIMKQNESFTLSARTRKIPNFSSIAHWVTILRPDTWCMAVREAAEQQTGIHGWGTTLTLRIVAVPDPGTLRTANCETSAPIRRSYEIDKQVDPDQL